MKFRDISKVLAKRNRLKESIARRKNKKLLRDQRFGQQGEVLHEIDFNSASVIKGILDAPISCGFEAETVWTEIYGEPVEDNSWVDELYWNEVNDLILQQEGRTQGQRSIDDIQQDFIEWLSETIIPTMILEILDDYVHRHRNDEDKMEEFADDEYGSDVLDEFKQAAQAQQDMFSTEMDDWGDTEWSAKMVKEEYMDEYMDWLRTSYEEEANDEAWENAEEDIDDWVKAKYNNSMYSMLAEHEVYLYDEDSSSQSGEGIYDIGRTLETWIDEHSAFSGLEVSASYHGTYGGTSQDYWRLEPDPSIEGEGSHGEIISPVYSSLREMLDEMKSLFEYFEENDVETNRSTGLHITLSLTDEHESKPNHLKMALLLGDRYLLKQFNREDNIYTKSQHKRVIHKARELLDNPKLTQGQTIEGIEKLLSMGVSREKYSSMNIKDTENDAGNTLFEFRITGGSSYHGRFEDIAKACIRYGVVLQSGYDKDAYKDDYLRAIGRALLEPTKASPEEVNQKKGLPNTPTTRMVDMLMPSSGPARFIALRELQYIYGGDEKRYVKLMNNILDLFNDNELMDNKLGAIHGAVPPQVSRIVRSSFKERGMSYADYLSTHTSLANREQLLNVLIGKEKLPPAKKISIKFGQEDLYMLKSELTKLQAGLPIDIDKIKIATDDDEYNIRQAIRNNNIEDSELSLKNLNQIVAEFKTLYGFDPLPSITLDMGSRSIQQVADNEYLYVPLSGETLQKFKQQRIYVGESVQFSKLPVMEQLKRIDNIDEKKLSSTHKKLKKVKEQALPIHNVPKDLKDILSKPLLAGDLRGQMNAYFIIPDPSMIKEFRFARASLGDNADLRHIVKQYAQAKLHPKNLEQ